MQVVLLFKYDPHNAQIYKFNSSARDASVISEHLSVFLTKFVVHIHKSCYFRASGQNSDTAVGFGVGHPDFLYDVDIVAPELYCSMSSFCAK